MLLDKNGKFQSSLDVSLSASCVRKESELVTKKEFQSSLDVSLSASCVRKESELVTKKEFQSSLDVSLSASPNYAASSSLTGSKVSIVLRRIS